MTVPFGSTANAHTVGEGSVWTSASEADTFIQDLNTFGGTNYVSAINAVMSDWGNGPSAADKTLIYFLSDGVANPGLDSTQTGVWEAFLADPDNHIDVANAIGISTSVSNAQLANIAWAPDNSDLLPIILNDANDLDGTLQGTVENTGVHNIFSDGETTDAGFGADGGHIASIEIDGVTYSWDGESLTKSDGECTVDLSGSSISVDTELGGRIDFYFAADGGHSAGDWSYKPPASLAGPTDEIFHYVLMDNDGDTSGADITVAVTADNYAPVVDLDSALSGTGYETRVSSNGSEITIFGENLAVSDHDSDVLVSAMVVLRGGVGSTDYNNDHLYFDFDALPVDGDSSVYHGSAGDLNWQLSSGGSGLFMTISGEASVEFYQQFLAALRFNTTSNDHVDRAVEVTVNDGESDSKVATAKIAIDDDPLIDWMVPAGSSDNFAFKVADGGDASVLWGDGQNTSGGPSFNHGYAPDTEGTLQVSLEGEQIAEYHVVVGGSSVQPEANVIGTTGNDVLIGSANVSTNKFDGGAGHDVNFASTAEDTFVFKYGTGHDVIVGFNAEHDHIDISAFGIADWNDSAKEAFLDTAVDTTDGLLFAQSSNSILVQDVHALTIDNLHGVVNFA
jgi:hypothetical protein